MVVGWSLGAAGLGTQNVDWMLSALVTAHVNNMAGEASCLKGLPGGRGYSFSWPWPDLRPAQLLDSLDVIAACIIMSPLHAFM